MFNLISRNLARHLVSPAILACIVFVGTNTAVAQVPTSTPRPTPAPNDPTRPPGTEPIPGTTTPAQNPSAPPGTQQTSPTTPPGSIATPQARPLATPPAGTVPGGSTEPMREPVIPQFSAKPLP